MIIKPLHLSPATVDILIRVLMLICCLFGMFVPLATIPVLMVTQKIFIAYMLLVSIGCGVWGKHSHMFSPGQHQTPNNPFFIASSVFLTCILLYIIGILIGGFLDMVWYSVTVLYLVR